MLKYDFNDCSSDNFKEKCENLYVKISKIFDALKLLNNEKKEDQCVLNAGSGIASIFNTGGTAGFGPARCEISQFLGIVNLKWFLYLDVEMPNNQCNLEYKVKIKDGWDTLYKVYMLVDNLIV